MSIRTCTLKATIVLLQLSIALPTYAAVTKLPDFPMDTKLATTNIVMPVDDSYSMDWEILLKKIMISGKELVTDNGVRASDKGGLITHLFPTSTDNLDGAKSYETTAAPSRENAYYRSPDYNLTFYNPNIDYDPWRPAYLKDDYNNSKSKYSLWTFSESATSGARYHPYFNLSSSSKTCTSATCSLLDLSAKNTGVQFSTDNNIVVSKAKYDYYPATYWLLDSTCSASDTTNCAVAPDGLTLRKYEINTSSTFNSSPFTLPNGAKIYRTRAEELQNFANWFTFYRKRKLVLAGGMGTVLNGLQNGFSNVKVAVVKFSETHDSAATWNDFVSGNTITLYDFQSADDTKNGNSAIGKLYAMQTTAPAGTTTNSALEYVGKRFASDAAFGTAEILRCSKNNAFILTDGFANDYTIQNYSWDGKPTDVNTRGDKTLYSRALSYNNQLSWWYKFGTAGQTNYGNTLNTYAITLGAYGNLYDGTKPIGDKDTKWATSVAANNMPSAIDDLWHAATSTDGKMLSAADPITLSTSITSILRSMFVSTSHTNVPVSEKYLSGNDTAIVTTFNTGDWSSDIKSHPVFNDLSDPANIGKLNTNITNWSVKSKLDARDPATRKIVTYSTANNKGIPFTVAELDDNANKVGGKKMLDSFVTSTSKADGADVVNYLRGDRTKEGATYNTRGGILGDIINASPVFVTGAVTAYEELSYKQFVNQQLTRQKMVYVGANDGMLHAFNADTGDEAWAYVPQMLHSKLNAVNEYVRLNYQHKFYVDGPITTWDVKYSDNAWHTILVGGLRSGGAGYYAVDVTVPPAANDTETTISKNIKWEVSNTNTNFSNMGYSYGKPVIVNTKNYGWVVLLSSGYNNADGKAHLFVVNAETGALIKDLSSADFGYADGSSTDPLGMAQVSYIPMSAPDPDTTGIIRYAYAGDLKGNVWKFDLSADDIANWKVKKFAENVNVMKTAGTTGSPITTAPAVGFIDTVGSPNPIPPSNGYAGDPLGGELPVDVKPKRLMVYVGTGQLLNKEDYGVKNDPAGSIVQHNGFLAMEDFMATTSEPNDTTEQNFVYGRGYCATFNCLRPVGLPDTSVTSAGAQSWIGEYEQDMTKWWIPGQYDKTTYCTEKSCSGTSFKDGNGKQRALRGWLIPFSATGNESVIQDPIFAYGFVSFVTTQRTDTTAGVCEQAFSAEFVLGASKGGTLPASAFYDGVAWSRKNLGFGIASFQTIVVGADGWVRAIVNTGGRTTTDYLPAKDTPNCKLTNSCAPIDCKVTNTCPAPPTPPVTATLRRWGWKEVFR